MLFDAIFGGTMTFIMFVYDVLIPDLPALPEAISSGFDSFIAALTPGFSIVVMMLTPALWYAFLIVLIGVHTVRPFMAVLNWLIKKIPGIS